MTRFSDTVSVSLNFDYDLECFPEINIAYQGTLKSVMKAVEEKYVNQVLEECNGRVDEAARRLGVHCSLLYRKREVKST
ncbi:helix-turn-helix domain-containing protein [Desulfosporosinus nitroreducens]|uniref:helix-turn-helix domain-containing protein n=1 Tax=Desulfosporosinus nitroreducens TaxID=2018668 RepID=UPI002852BC21|nr:helix-turn-helix domain-containing protein [Desulfosporosinus nitroreducens]